MGGEFGGFDTTGTDGNRPLRMSKVEACDLMAEMLRKEGFMVSPGDLRDLFATHWNRLSVLAHAIHEGR